MGRQVASAWSTHRRMTLVLLHILGALLLLLTMMLLLLLPLLLLLLLPLLLLLLPLLLQLQRLPMTCSLHLLLLGLQLGSAPHESPSSSATDSTRPSLASSSSRWLRAGWCGLGDAC